MAFKRSAVRSRLSPPKNHRFSTKRLKIGDFLFAIFKSCYAEAECWRNDKGTCFSLARTSEQAGDKQIAALDLHKIEKNKVLMSMV